MICEYCGKEFKSKRSTARYCSEKCQKAMKRSGVSRTEDGVSRTISQTESFSQTEKAVSIPVSRTKDESINNNATLSVNTHDDLLKVAKSGEFTVPWQRVPIIRTHLITISVRRDSAGAIRIGRQCLRN